MEEKTGRHLKRPVAFDATLAQVRRHRSMEGAGDDQSEELQRVLRATV